MKLEGPFVAGHSVSGQITETCVDDEVAAQQRPYVGAPVTLQIVAVEPRRRLAFRWNPLPGPEFADLTTLVEFTLTERTDGVLLEIVESGYQSLPDEHRDTTFHGNSQGWAIQAKLIATFLEVAR
jgi:uncharacterized protein YndB with AHSA1/START domain